MCIGLIKVIDKETWFSRNLILSNDVKHLGIAGRILRAQPLNQNPVKVSAILYFSSDAKIPWVIFFLLPANMPTYYMASSASGQD